VGRVDDASHVPVLGRARGGRCRDWCGIGPASPTGLIGGTRGGARVGSTGEGMMSVDASQRAAAGGRLLRPHEVTIPDDCAGWEALYPYHTVFGADRQEVDAERFWFHDGLHFPEPLYPFDEVVAGCVFVGLGQANARLFAMPPALGGEYWILNGYVYSSPNAVADPATVQRRSEL